MKGTVDKAYQWSSGLVFKVARNSPEMTMAILVVTMPVWLPCHIAIKGVKKIVNGKKKRKSKIPRYQPV